MVHRSPLADGRAPRPARRTFITLLAAGPTLAVVLAGSAAGAVDSPGVHGSLHAEATDVRGTVVTGQFESYRPGATAISYDPALVPEGAQLSVLSTSVLGGTRVQLAVRGLLPEREYGAHAHSKTCGPSPKDAGGHFQNEIDPVQPSIDPVYANPDNEIWLDFTTDAAGNGVTMATVDWTFGDRHPNSVVLHEHHTHVLPGDSGVAGPRLACATVPF